MLNEAHLPFRQLLLEVPDPEGTPGGAIAAFPRLQQLRNNPAALLTEELDTGVQLQESFGRSSASSSRAMLPSEARRAPSQRGPREEAAADTAGSQSPLFSAIVRARLMAHLLGCYEAVASELTGEEAQLWDAFVAVDTSLSCTLRVPGGEQEAKEVEKGLHDALTDALGSAARADSCIRAIFDRACEEGECDFADLLDVFAEVRQGDQLWTLRSMVRSGLSHFLGSNGEPASTRASRISDLRARCGRQSTEALASSAAAYQRSLVLTASWRCEQRLLALVCGADRSSSPFRGDSRAAGALDALLSVLHGIHAELAPSERVLWELLGSEDRNFDGAFTKREVLAAIGELLSYHLAREAIDAAGSELEELQRLRSDCQRRSVEALFGTTRRTTVTLADVLRWWWDMAEEYRMASGLAVPSALLRRSLHRQPEEMFRVQLRAVASDPPAARVALRGHARAFAELRALAVRRTIEGLHSRSPTETRTTTSEAGFTSLAGALAVEDCESAQEEADEPPQEAHEVPPRPKPLPENDPLL